MLELLNEIFWDLMIGSRWFRRSIAVALAVLLLWMEADLSAFVTVAVVLSVFEGIDYLFRAKRSR